MVSVFRVGWSILIAHQQGSADQRLTSTFIGRTLVKPKPVLLVNSAPASTGKVNILQFTDKQYERLLFFAEMLSRQQTKRPTCSIFFK